MPVHNHTYVTDHFVLVGNETTVDSNMLSRLSANSVGQVVECVVVETEALAHLGIVTSDEGICQAISLAHKLRAGVFVPFPTDLGSPGHVFQLLGACLISGVPLFLNPSAVPWSRAILPGLPLTEAVGHVVAGWEQYAPAAIAEVLAAQVHAYLTFSIQGEHNLDAGPAAQVAGSISPVRVAKAIAMLDRNQVEPRQMCRLLNLLQIPREDGSRRWTIKYLARHRKALGKQGTSIGPADAPVAENAPRELRGAGGVSHRESMTYQGAASRLQRRGYPSASLPLSTDDQEPDA